MIKIHNIGAPTSIPNWPSHGTIEGLLDALSRWELDPRLDMSEDPQFEPHPARRPYRSLASKYGGQIYSPSLGRNVYLAGGPIYPNHPDTISFLGDFVGHSFLFHLDTDEADLVARLDQAIADNLTRHGRGTRGGQGQFPMLNAA